MELRMIRDPAQPRHDWTLDEIEGLYALPFTELVFQAAAVHRTWFDPAEVQRSQLLSVKTGGCSEDCGYCSQSAHFDTGLKASRLMAAQAVIADAREFFFSEHFKVAIDIVLSTSTNKSVRREILEISRRARRPVETAWAEALVASGVEPSLAADIVALTLSLVRGMALRTLWDNDPKWFDHLFTVWRRMIRVFLTARTQDVARATETSA